MNYSFDTDSTIFICDNEVKNASFVRLNVGFAFKLIENDKNQNYLAVVDDFGNLMTVPHPRAGFGKYKTKDLDFDPVSTKPKENDVYRCAR